MDISAIGEHFLMFYVYSHAQRRNCYFRDPGYQGSADVKLNDFSILCCTQDVAISLPGTMNGDWPITWQHIDILAPGTSDRHHPCN